MTQTDPSLTTALKPRSVADVLEATDAVCEAAMTRCLDGMAEVPLRFAGQPVHMRVAGELLTEHMTAAFEHLRDSSAAAETPALRIDVWDRMRTGLGCPGVPYPPEATICLDAGLLTHYLNQQVVRYEHGHLTTTFDRINGHIYSARKKATEFALNERSKPFPIMLATWYQDQGVQQLHAGLVSKGDPAHGRGVLFIGASGSGKSTAALACALDGFNYLGDDHNGLEIGEDGRCWGHSYYNAARIGDGHMKHFPELAEHAVPPVSSWDHKSLVYMSRIIPQRMAARARIDAVVLPQIVPGGKTQFKRASRMECLLALAPSTLKVPFSAGVDGFMNLTEFLPRTSCFKLQLGDDVRAIPRCVERILDEAGEANAASAATDGKGLPCA